MYSLFNSLTSHYVQLKDAPGWSAPLWLPPAMQGQEVVTCV